MVSTKAKVVSRGFEVLSEAISLDNVQVMAELVAMKGTKLLIAFTGQLGIQIHNNLYRDIVCKDVYGYMFSDSYELVQTVAAFLCEHFGEHLDDYYYSSKKGKPFTLKMYCYKLIDRVIGAKYRRNKSDISLDLVYPCRLKYEMTEEDYQDYAVVDAIIDALNLTDNHKAVLNYRMSGASFPEIGRILNRCSSTIYDLLKTIQRRYINRYGEY